MKDPNTQPFVPVEHSNHHVRRALVAAGVALSLVGTMPDQTDAATRESQHTPNREHTEPSLVREVEQLPGYRQKVSVESRKALSDATVKIGRRIKEGNEEWEQFCTGAKVTDGEDVYIKSAAHCFKFLAPGYDDTTNGWEGKKDTPHAFNIYDPDTSGYEYVIYDPKTPRNLRQPLATVTAISASNRAQDQVLLKVSPINSEPTADETRSFDQIPALPMATTQEKAVKRPSPGQLVAMYGVPTANNDEAVGGTGRYLGRVSYVQPNGTIQFKDIVGIVTSNVKEDACNFGASGSLFSATIKNKSTGRTRTYISGSLSTRISDNDVAMLDQSDYSSLRGDLGNEIDAVAHWKEEIQQQLGVNVSGFDSLCSYSVNLPHSNKELIEGFKVNAPAFSDQGEGDPVFADGTVGKGGEFIGNK